MTLSKTPHTKEGEKDMRNNTMIVNGNRVLHTSTNRRAFWFWKDYERSTTNTVNTAYKTRPSDAKREIEQGILRDMVEQNGHTYRVLSHNGFCFSCGYLIPTEYGELLRVETKANTYYIVNDGEYISK